MDEQKQIEEMVKELAKDMGIAFQLANTTRFGVIAADLIRIGYRKIPENAVIVSKQVWEEHIENWDKTTKAVEERVCGETAEKFAELVKMAFYYHFDELIPSIMADKIDEICKEIIGEEK